MGGTLNVQLQTLNVYIVRFVQRFPSPHSATGRAHGASLLAAVEEEPDAEEQALPEGRPVRRLRDDRLDFHLRRAGRGIPSSFHVLAIVEAHRAPMVMVSSVSPA